ncbi:hypothetical protein CFC21_004789 [Triticum aestivum]|uniref:Uncharacterized protein n=2 Tax=Triticum aestivum TaxID=4565 RepID=A0A3B5YRF8_WHEAT|nr:hypothetical protein CFC21_004789 [Triticum aestivum]
MGELGEWFQEGNQIIPKRFLAIDGFGGLGKITLALELYRKFGDGFDCRAFVQVSQKFDLLMLLKSLFIQFREQQAHDDLSVRVEELEEIPLKKMLARQLEDKRYLILIDDIWSVSAWEKINDSLPDSSKGGRVVVTTRFKSVAVACCRQNGFPYEHKPLDKKKSYNLFRQIIPNAPHHPTDVASDVLKKCGGLPLVITVVAGLVASKLSSGPSASTLDHYLPEVANALSGELETNLTTQGVTKILERCYTDLPADLKTCLLYMSMFPKGRSISRKRLIRRWISEGFIIEKHGKTVEEVAEDCFNELIVRNLIRAVSNSSNGKVKNYQIHDMVLEYIVSKSSTENFITVVGGHWQTPFPSYKVRRLSVQRSDEKETVQRMKLSHVRSLTAFESFKELHSCLLKFQILQVLDLESCRDLSSHRLDKICKMHQLKYLSLRRTDIGEIPSQIGMLEYSEVLDIRETKVRQLPKSVKQLKQMTHLLTGNKSKKMAVTLTEEMTNMTALETLSGVGIYGRSRSNQGKTGIFKAATSGTSKEVIQSLEKLTNLKKLSLYIIGMLEKANEESLLSAIEHLSSCSLKFLAIDDGFTGFLENSFSSSKAPPEHLHTLELSGMLRKLPQWIERLHSLGKLTLSLTSLKKGTLKDLGKLPQLFSLIFSIDATNDPSVLKIIDQNTSESGGEIFVLPGGFEKLKLLRFVAIMLPPLSFLGGAMPVLQRLELRFRISEGVHGLENLASLQQVFLTVSSKAPKAAEEIKRLASKIGSLPSVIVDEYNESSVEPSK